MRLARGDIVRSSLSAGLLVYLVLGASFGPLTPEVASNTSEHSLLIILPGEGMTVSNGSQVVLVFSDLMNLTTVLDSMHVNWSSSYDISLSIKVECGDGSTVIIAPRNGTLRPGPYQLSFAQNVTTLDGLSFLPEPNVVNFTVSDTFTAGSVAVGTSFGVGLTSGIEITSPSRSFTLEIGFSIEFDLSDLIRALRVRSEVRKVSECNGTSVSVALSIGFGASFDFTVNPNIVFGRQDRNRTIAAPFYVRTRGPINVAWGEVVDSESRPLANVTVELRRASAPVATTSTDADGFYAFFSVSPGVYTVCASASGYNDSCFIGMLTSGGTLKIDHQMNRSVIERLVKEEVTPVWAYAITAGGMIIGVVGVIIGLLLRKRGGRGPKTKTTFEEER